jgi:hypothetical protein
MMKLPALSEQVMKEGDVTTGDDSPRQGGWWDYIEGGLSAPALTRRGATTEDSPRQGGFWDYIEGGLSAPPLAAAN